MLLFIDFDGVLHPINQTDPFSLAGALARVLDDFPSVEIVISSAWRKTHSLDQMRAFFPTALRSRIIGVTPVFRIGDADTSAVPGARFHEICKYLTETGNQHRRWLAIDDDPEYFPPGCANLLLCDGRIGFSAREELVLREVITKTKWMTASPTLSGQTTG